ncbi:MAG: hypothetical protein AB7S26_09465 [Sandaracinaceae bacterium]
MSLTSTLLKAGALYALGRAASNVKKEDLEKVAGISTDDLRRYGFDRLDTALHAMGLQRESTVPSGTAMILSGFAAGAIVGAGATFLFYSEQGKDVRKKIAEYFAGKGEATSESKEGASANANGGASVNV